MKILSIDLDFISGPAILHNDQKIYEHCDSDGLDMWPVPKWYELFSTYPNEFSHELNIQNYHYCLRTYLRTLAHTSEVYFGYDHDNILYGLEGHTDIEVVNIDHHDDVFSGNFGSPDDELRSLQQFERIMEGNWGLYLRKQNRLKSFTWIGNSDSHNLVHIPFAEKHLNNFKFSTPEEYVFDNYEFDQIFVCLSPGYIPPLHWHMIGTFMTIFEEMTGKEVDLGQFRKKYEMEKYYQQVTDYIRSGKM
tara:strand:+ start:13327 stop:14070 length:744 start_codon:yes stop_codon:yes gene_type:complete